MTLPVLSVCRCIQLSQSSAIWRGAAPTVVSGARPHEGSQKAQACAHKGKCPPWRALGAILKETWRDLSLPVRGSVRSRDGMMASGICPHLDVRSPVETLPMSVSIEVRANPLSVTLRFTGTHRRAKSLPTLPTGTGRPSVDQARLISQGVRIRERSPSADSPSPPAKSQKPTHPP